MAPALGVVILLLALGSKTEARVPREGSDFLPGVVVEKVGPGSTLERSGVRPGDIVISWARFPDLKMNPGVALEQPGSFFDWHWMVREQAPSATVRLSVERAGKTMNIEITPGEWDAVVRPRLPASAREAYVEGKQSIEEHRIDEGLSRWGKAKKWVERLNNDGLLGWFHIVSAETLAKANRLQEAQAELRSALLVRKSTRAQAFLWDKLGELCMSFDDVECAESAFRMSLRMRAETWGEGFGSAAARVNLARIELRRGLLEESRETLEDALAIVKEIAPRSLNCAEIRYMLGVVARIRGNLDRAEPHFLRALEIQERRAPWSRARARSLGDLADLARRRGDLDLAEAHITKAQAILDWIAPYGPEQGALLHHLGMIARDRGESEQAKELLLRAVELRKQFAPNSLALAYSLNNLGLLAEDMGELEKAEEYLLAALDTRARIAPDSIFVAHSFNNLGLVAHARGALDVAADYYRKAYEIKKRVVPETVSAAFTLNNMGTVAMARNELELAADYFEQALAIKEKRTPGALSIANSLSNLGSLAARRDDQDRAEQYFRRALVIRQRLAPRGRLVASSLEDLGDVALSRNQLQTATDFYRRALEITNTHAPSGINTAGSLKGLGEVALRNGDLTTAENRLQQALEIELKSVPYARRTAQTLFLLAEVFRAAGEPVTAVGYSRQAVDVLERQIGHLGGSHDVRAGFRALHERDFRHHIELLLMTGREAEAFHALERSRARSLLDMLTERDLVFAADVPEELDGTRRRLAVQYDRKQQQIAVLDPEAGGDLLPRLIRERDELRRRQEEVSEEIRRASPRLAALQYPQPLQLEMAMASLDPGTVMLSFSVGEDASDLFVITPESGFSVLRLDVGEGEIRRDVEQFRSLIQETRTASLRMANVVATGKRLFSHLLEPALPDIQDAERLVILPDGPLHRLPFGALVLQRGENEAGLDRDWLYLAEWKPLHFVQSATLFAELKKDRCALSGAEDDSQGPSLVAFGNPLSAGAPGQGEMGAERSRHLDLEPLPATRSELERVGALYPDDAHVFLGKEATEEAVFSIGIGPRIFHFATHSRLDDRTPLDSALVLSPPADATLGRENGLLQAWEIIERIRISADLVVLSACRSGLGKELGGEGLIGLTRAFQYAGARSVLASLWDAADAKTAELMVAFHKQLITGKSKTEALQAAQIELIRGKMHESDKPNSSVLHDASAPYYWASFQIYGDWR